MAKVSLDEQIACVRREVAMRERCYPQWGAGNPQKAAYYALELARMEAVLRTLEWLQGNKDSVLAALCRQSLVEAPAQADALGWSVDENKL